MVRERERRGSTANRSVFRKAVAAGCCALVMVLPVPPLLAESAPTNAWGWTGDPVVSNQFAGALRFEYHIPPSGPCRTVHVTTQSDVVEHEWWGTSKTTGTVRIACAERQLLFRRLVQAGILEFPSVMFPSGSPTTSLTGHINGQRLDQIFYSDDPYSIMKLKWLKYEIILEVNRILTDFAKGIEMKCRLETKEEQAR